MYILHSLIFFMKYTECLEYISEVNSKKGISLGLDNIRELCLRLGNPQNKLKFVHIAGTNGKGSTLAFVSTILKESGYKVGRYISPTIRDYRERIQINGKMISMKAIASYMDIAKKACDEMVADGFGHPTAFEIETAISFLYFADMSCDIVVLETGMGGIEDATNIVETTVLSILVSISMDHMQFLGDSLTDIAKVKCGIIKKNTPVVTGFQKDEVLGVIKECCNTNNSSLFYLENEELKKCKYKANEQSFEFDQNRYAISLRGVWQNQNAALAIKSCEILANECGFDKICLKTIKKGLENTVWPARFQIVNKKPLLIIDGAHNADAADKLRETIDIFYKDKSKIYIMGMFRDKEVDYVVSRLAYDGDMVFTCATPNNSRALSPVELADIVRNHNPRVTSCDSVQEAVEFATSVADNNSVIIACGSLAYLGKIIDIFDGR